MPASKATFTLETARGQLPKPSHVAGRILHQRMAGLSGMTQIHTGVGRVGGERPGTSL